MEKQRYSEVVAKACADNPAWRYGQAAFNALPDWLAEEVRGTRREPFHRTNPAEVEEFIEWAHQRIQEESCNAMQRSSSSSQGPRT